MNKFVFAVASAIALVATATNVKAQDLIDELQVQADAHRTSILENAFAYRVHYLTGEEIEKACNDFDGAITAAEAAATAEAEAYFEDATTSDVDASATKVTKRQANPARLNPNKYSGVFYADYTGNGFDLTAQILKKSDGITYPYTYTRQSDGSYTCVATGYVKSRAGERPHCYGGARFWKKTSTRPARGQYLVTIEWGAAGYREATSGPLAKYGGPLWQLSTGEVFLGKHPAKIAR